MAISPEKGPQDITSEQIHSKLTAPGIASKKIACRLAETIRERFPEPASVESDEFHSWAKGLTVRQRRVMANAIIDTFMDQTGTSSNVRRQVERSTAKQDLAEVSLDLNR